MDRQGLRIEGKRSDDAKLYPSDTNLYEDVFITLIHATNIVSGLRRMPATFYVSVAIDQKTTKTSSKPVFIGRDMVQWDEEILLPAERSSNILCKVYASFEPEPRLGEGQLLGLFTTTVGDVLDGHGQLQHVKFHDNGVFSSFQSLRIITERNIRDINRSITQRGGLNFDTTNQLRELIDTGSHALLRYHQSRNPKDLREAITHYQHVLDTCPTDRSCHSATLFNLATARFIGCQDDYHFHDLDFPITMYRDALRLRVSSDPDRFVTALDLCFALLALLRRKRQSQMAGGMSSGKFVPTGVAEIYAYRVAWLALQMAGIFVPIKMVKRQIAQEDCAEGDDKKIQMARARLLDIPDWKPSRPTYLIRLGGLLHNRFRTYGELTDLHEAVSMMEQAVELTSNDDPDKQYRLDVLCCCLLSRFERLGDLVDLNRCIPMLQEALRLAPNLRSNRLEQLSNLGSSLLHRFQRLGDLGDIKMAIPILEKATRLTSSGHPLQATVLTNLTAATALSYHHHCSDGAEINKAISTSEKVVQDISDKDTAKPACLANIGRALLCRFERLGGPADLDSSIVMLEEAVHLVSDDSPKKSTYLSELASLLSTRFKSLGNLADIDRSISMSEGAVSLTSDDHPEKQTRLNALGTRLCYRFENLGDVADINQAVLICGKAVDLAPDGDPKKAYWLSTLGTALTRRFEHAGNLTDVDKAISIFEDAIRLATDTEPGLMSNLSSSLLLRFKCLEDLVDINKSVSMAEKAVHLSSDGHPQDPTYLNSLGNSLSTRFHHLREVADIKRVVSVFEKVIHLSPYDPGYLTNYGGSLSSYFEVSGDIAYIDKSISVLEEAIRLIPHGHPSKPSLLNELGRSLTFRFNNHRDPEDIRKSTQMFGEAVHLLPDGHVNRSIWSRALANASLRCFKLFHDPYDLAVAIFHFSVASHVSTAPASARFPAACQWIDAARLDGDIRNVLDAYTTAINLLPELAWLGLPLTERHRVLLQAADLGRDAAVAALEAGCPNMAIEWLEQGRSVVWNQFLKLRTPVDDLRVEYPNLADQLQQISADLERAHSLDDVTSRPTMLVNDFKVSRRDSGSAEKDARRRHGLALQRDKLIDEIRSLPGFDGFLLPKTIDQLAAAAHSGPVIYLNASQYRCDALIIKAELENVIHVPLPDTSYEQTECLQSVLRLLLERDRLVISRDDVFALVATEENRRSERLLDLLFAADDIEDIDQKRAVKVKTQRVGQHTPDEIFGQILGYLWDNVVKPVMDALGYSTPISCVEKMPHIYWCPTGPFAFLPIHAAGLYDTAKGTKLSDFAISSYVSSLCALALPSARGSSNPNVHLVAVPQPETDGLTGLSCVKEEIEHIRTLSTSSPFVTVQESDGTIEDVMERMTHADWVHFACHGIQDPDDPLDSGLCLADGRRLKLSDIIWLSRPHGGLAFLSACQTAQGDEKLSEESVHLAAGMLLAGYGGVIATMWAIRDPDAPRVTKKVYEHLFRDGKVPDSMEAAEALHHAVQDLRKDSSVSFFSWVPFVHFGR